MSIGHKHFPESISGLKKLLIANRGEIAVRIAKSAADLGLATVAIFSKDDEQSLHLKRADQAHALPGVGASAYLNIDAVLEAAKATGADCVHPGYGFLAENAEFAKSVEDAGLVFVGPTPESLSLLGDKIAAKQKAKEIGVPTIPGTLNDTNLEEAIAFFNGLPENAAMVIKAVAGGGGRGMRVVEKLEAVEEAWQRCRSEALSAFGKADVYVERFLPDARHLEVQILGDGTGACVQFGERECTLQRRHQKVIEIAPSPSLNDVNREALLSSALKLAESTQYRSLGTIEFLMADDSLFFIEANPRIQVEHTVTEEVFDVDLVHLQLLVASGLSFDEINLQQQNILEPRGIAVQCRVNLELMDNKANAKPTSGVFDIYEPPTGSGVRVDGFAYSGYRSSTSFDSMVAKVIVHSRSDSLSTAFKKADRALSEFRIVGIDNNIAWLRALLNNELVTDNKISTNFIEQHADVLAKAAENYISREIKTSEQDSYVKQHINLPEGFVAVLAPMQATVISLDVAVNDTVVKGQQIAILEAMKMEHIVVAQASGTVSHVLTEPGITLMDGEAIIAIEVDAAVSQQTAQSESIDLDAIRGDLREVEERRALGLDENRPEAVAKRHKRGQQTARENIAQICDEDTFVEYGEFAIAAQSQRRSIDDLMRNTSGDGILTGLGQVNGKYFDEELARCAFAVGDYMVLAGTQGQRHHRKLDRLLSVVSEWNIPLIFFAEGGGGRPGDTDRVTHAGISNGTFTKFAQLSGQVPMVGVVSGRCFAGNAAFLGCCDVVIADESSNIGMAGPAMIEGGGLGVYPPEAIGPIDIQCQNGVVDIRVKNENEACEVAKKYLSYFQGKKENWKAPDQRKLRHVVPENRLRVYEVRDAIHSMADEDSVLELRQEFGLGIVTAFIRIEGKPFGVFANNTQHLGGAIDADAADKASRFIQLCDAFDIPMISLCDCPGFMVGPEAEKTALVRHVCRMYVSARSVSVPIFGIVLRKCYGLGAMAMLGGGTYDNFFTVSWPSGEFGPMGLEGAVKLGFRREFEALDSAEEKQALYEKLLDEMYQQGKAIAVANSLEIDAVIDPVDTRKWVMAGLKSCKLRKPLSGQKRPFVDTW